LQAIPLLQKKRKKKGALTCSGALSCIATLSHCSRLSSSYATVPLTIVFFASATRAEKGSALLLGECAHFTEDVLTVHRLYLRLIAFQQDKAHMLS